MRRECTEGGSRSIRPRSASPVLLAVAVADTLPVAELLVVDDAVVEGVAVLDCVVETLAVDVPVDVALDVALTLELELDVAVTEPLALDDDDELADDVADAEICRERDSARVGAGA